MEFQVGQTVGDYEILSVLGAGGMGKVYKVRNIVSDRIEAMKVLLPDLNTEADLAERFLREIKISATLEHPNIAALRTAHRADNHLLMIMEFVEGSGLDVIIRHARVSTAHTIDYMAQALAALSYAHSRGVTHRDIKPANIMLTPAGIIKLMDFGIARMASDQKLTKTGLLVGSIYYMSPEQIEGKEPDARSDLYSLGVTLYEIATGKRPFNGDSEYSIMKAHLGESPRPPIELDGTIPGGLNEIILTALAKDPAKRFQSADAFRNALMIAGGAKPAAPAVTPLASGPPVKRGSNRMVYMLAGSAATIAVIVLAATQIPKYMRTSASGGRPAPVEAVRAPDPATKPPAVMQASPPVAASTPDKSASQPEPAAVAKGGPSSQLGQTARLEISHPGRNAVVPPLIRPGGAGQAPTHTPALTQMAQAQAPPPVASPAPAPAVPTAAIPPATDTAALGELRERMMLLAARVGGVRSSLDRIQKEQERSGQGLRSDMVSSQQRMVYHMDEAESHWKKANAAAAKKSLDAAEREVDRLESFLGK